MIKFLSVVSATMLLGLGALQTQGQTTEVKPQSVQVSQTTITMMIAQSTQLSTTVLPENTTNKSILYRSLSPIIDVRKDGLVSAISAGTGQIKVMCTADTTISTTVTIVAISEGPQPTDIQCESSSITAYLGETKQLTCHIVPVNVVNNRLTYTISSPQVASIDNNGLIYPYSLGTTTIVMTSYDGKISETVELTVLPRTLCANPEAPQASATTIYYSRTLDDIRQSSPILVNVSVTAQANSKYFWKKIYNSGSVEDDNTFTATISEYDSSDTKLEVFSYDIVNNCYSNTTTFTLIEKCTTSPTLISAQYFTIPFNGTLPTFEVKESDAIWLDSKYQIIDSGASFNTAKVLPPNIESAYFYVTRRLNGCVAELRWVNFYKNTYIINGYVTPTSGAISETYIIDINNGAYKISTDASGYFKFYAPDKGVYHVTVYSQKDIVAQDLTQSVTLTETASSQRLLFSPQKITKEDLQLNLVTTRVVVGRELTATLDIKNYGSKKRNVPLTIEYAPEINPRTAKDQFVAASKRAVEMTLDSINASSQITVTFPFTTSTDWTITGKQINFKAYVSKPFDTIAANDSSLFVTTIRNSMDPNDKAVSPSFGEKGYVLKNKSLEYLIRFQNTGTIDAENIKVVDTLNENLDLSSFEVIAQSHPMTWQMDGRRVTFSFADIHLLDSKTNEAASHGYIKYRIKPKADLPENTQVKNTAYIYFDYNPAVITNTTQSQYVSKLPSIGLPQAVTETSEIAQLSSELLPNPASKTVRIAVSEPSALSIISSSGVEVRSIASYNGTAIDIADLATGIYTVKINSAHNTATHRLSKQ